MGKQHRPEMVKLTLLIPKALRRRMDNHPNLNWSHLFRQTIQCRLDVEEEEKVDG